MEISQLYKGFVEDRNLLPMVISGDMLYNKTKEYCQEIWIENRLRKR